MQGTTNSKIAGVTINNQDKTITSNGSYTADSGYTGLGTVSVQVPSSNYNRNAKNLSSFDRVSGEKVWVNTASSPYEIIDYTSSSINTFVGTCKENITIGSTGVIAVVDDGQLVQHMVRDFSLGAGVSDSDIDDTNMTFEFNNYAASGTLMNKYLVSPQLDLPVSQLGDLLLKVRFKVTAANPGDTVTAANINNKLILTTYNNSTDYPIDGASSNYPNIYAVGSTYLRMTGAYNYVSQQELDVNYGNIVDIDKWITATLRCDSTASPKSLFTVSDAIGNTGSASDNYIASSEGNIQRVFIGVRWSDTNNVKTIIDLSQSGLYTANGNTALWTPYKSSFN